MRLFTLSDYITLTYQLGLLTESYAQANSPELDREDPDQRELCEAFDGSLNTLAEYMDLLNLPATRNLVTSAAEQIGDLREVQDIIMETLATEIYRNLALQYVTPSLPLDLWHDPARLQSDISSLMPSGIYASLSDLARNDLVEAGQCLADRKANAAAVLLLRCVEATLRALYEPLTGEPGTEMEWHAMEQGISRANPKNKGMYVAAPLRDLRLNHRNKAMHAQKGYDVEEAQRLFHLCIEAMTRMVETLSDNNRPEGIG